MKTILHQLVIILVLLSSIQAQTKTISKEDYYDKTLAMLIGQCGGVVTGFEYVAIKNEDGTIREPYEQWLGLPDEWFTILNGTLGGTTLDEHNYFSTISHGMILSDDDQHVDFMNQVILNTYGPTVAWQDIKHSWQYYDLMDFGGTSDAIGLMNSKDLIAPQMGASEYGNNGHWLPESYIQHETMGGAYPGMPYQAAQTTYKFSRMSGQGEPVEWGMYWAAATGIAYFETDIRDVLIKALDVVPGNSYVRETYDICVQLHQQYPNDWRAAVYDFWHNHERYVCYVGTEKTHLIANVNNANCILSCLYGKNDYMETLRIQSLSGGDAECGASTVCGVLGVIHGMAGTPQEFKNEIYVDGTGIWRNDMAHALHMDANFPEDTRFTDLAKIIQENAEQSIMAFGGSITGDSYIIKEADFKPQVIAFDNWDFEDGNLDGWQIWNSPGSTNSHWAELQWSNKNLKSTLAATGYYKATLITSSADAECKIYRTVSGLKPGATYKIEGRINAPGGREARIYADKYGGDYKYVSIQGNRGYPFRYLYVTLGQENTSMEIGCHAVATENASRWCSFDDIVVTEVANRPITTYECENTESINLAVVASSGSASGGKFLDQTHLDGVTFSYNIQGSYEGEHTLRIFYANAGGFAQYNLTVNGTSIGTVQMGDTGPWTNFSGNNVEANVRLHKGDNTVTFTRVDGGATFDKIEVLSPYEIAFPANSAELISGGIYTIKAKHSGLFITADSLPNGARFKQQAFTGSDLQYFRIEETTSGEYYITPLGSDKAIEVSGSNTDNGGIISLWNYWGGATQKWRIVQLENGYYKLLNSNSGKAFDIEGQSIDEGANLTQWEYLGGNNQQFELTPVGQSSVVASGQVYRIISKENGRSFDMDGISQANAAKLITWDYLNATNQQYKLEKDGLGYTIQAMHSFKYLELAGASKADGAQVQQYYRFQGAHQRWIITPTEDGYFTIKNDNSGKFMQLASDGSNVVQNPANNLDNQKWSFVPVYRQNFQTGSPAISIDDFTNHHFKEGDRINLAATVSDKQALVEKVEFYINDALFSTENLAPYSLYHTDLLAGEYSVKAVLYYDGGKTIESNSVSLTVESVLETQKINLIQGWNLISMNVHPADSSITVLFPNASVVKTAEGSFHINRPAYLNAFSMIETGKGYLLYSDAADTIEIKGVVATPVSFAVPSGWSVLGNPFTESVTLESAFGPEYSDIKMIKNFDEFWVKDGDMNTLKTLEPGKAYYILK